MEDVEELLSRATRYRRWAGDTPDKRAAEALMALADESEAKASQALVAIKAQGDIEPN